MARKGDPQVLKFVVRWLRDWTGLSQEEFAARCGMDQSDVSRMEAGERAPRMDQLRRMAGTANIDWSLVVHARRFFGAAVAAMKRRSQHAGLRDLRFKPAVVQPGLLAEIPLRLEEWAAVADPQEPAETLRIAAHIWQVLAPLPMAERRRRLGLSLRAARSWAVAVTLCHESERVATHSAKAALELAELALFIAGQVEGDDLFRTALQGYCWLYIANARRVGNEFDGADAAFTRAAGLLKAGADPGGLLPAWRLLDLQASLRRAQHRFSEALELLEQALAARGVDPLSAARIMVKKSNILQQMLDFVGALAALQAAGPAIEEAGDQELLFACRFNTAINLVHLERYAEAAGLLPGIRELAERQQNRLSLTRLDWLEAKTLAGLGQKQEAMGRLEQVQGVFTAEELPYDAALAGLDLAVLWLEARRTKDVAQMAVGMEWIFRHQGIEREALAALKLFCDAARQEAATADLARQVSADIEKVRRTAPPRPKSGKA